MDNYRAEIVTEVLEILAENKEQAEKKYKAYFEDGECLDCKDNFRFCGCVKSYSETFHTMERE